MTDKRFSILMAGSEKGNTWERERSLARLFIISHNAGADTKKETLRKEQLPEA